MLLPAGVRVEVDMMGRGAREALEEEGGWYHAVFAIVSSLEVRRYLFVPSNAATEQPFFLSSVGSLAG